MKKFILILAVFVAVQTLRATDFPLAQSGSTINATLITATTNATSSSIFVEVAKNHTFHILAAATGTNNVYLDRSLNNSAWICFSTNSFSASGGTNEVTATGHFSYVRARVSGATNTISTTVLYLGGN